MKLTRRGLFGMLLVAPVVSLQKTPTQNAPPAEGLITHVLYPDPERPQGPHFYGWYRKNGKPMLGPLYGTENGK